MGGQSSSETTQSSKTAPWQPAQNTLTGILGQINNYLPQTGINQTQTNALNTIEANANNAASTYSPTVQGITTNLLNGGGATNELGRINANYDQYLKNTSPLANNTNYNPMQTPGIGDQLQALKDSITTDVNGSFAGAGRDGSGYNQKALGQGLTAGLAPILTNQYNQNVQNQQAAAGNLYNAGNTTSGLATGLNQTALGNQSAGFNMIPQATELQNAGATTALAAEAQRLGIPLQNLGLLSSIGIPIAGLGSESSGTSKTTKEMSGVEQFMGITKGLGDAFKAATAGAAFFSDVRLKKDIECVGKLPNGLNVYTFRYIWGDPRTYLGVMAQEVLNVIPEAVSENGGYLMVDYGKVLEHA